MKLQRLLLFFILVTAACNQKTKVVMNVDIDPDIVLVNIENGDRRFIAGLIRAVDSCRPAVIAVNVRFLYSKEYEEDSVLVATFKAVHNDIVSYGINRDLELSRSHLKFRSFFTGEGVLDFESSEHGIRMKPLMKVSDEVHESFALRILRQWKPGFRHDFETDQSVTVDFKRPLEKFLHLYQLSQDLSAKTGE
jgi:hypothetical protein